MNSNATYPKLSLLLIKVNGGGVSALYLSVNQGTNCIINMG